MLDGPRSGETFDAERDTIRLNQQAHDVWNFMRSGTWWSLNEIASFTQHPEASISARLRDFRKSRFGGHTVERLRIRNTWFYRLVPNPDTKMSEDA